MEFRYLTISICVLFSLALAEEGNNHASLRDEDYWQAVWPNTPIPSGLRELLKPSQAPAANDELNDLVREVNGTPYPTTFFFNHDFYPGKIMNVQFSKYPYAQVFRWLRDVKDVDKEGYTFGEVCIKNGAAKGEHKSCAKSLRTLMDFVISKLGKNIHALSSSFVGNKEEQYTLEGLQNLGDKAVMCHGMNFQKVVFYCHEIHATTVFVASLVAGDGTKTQALAVCHADTSGMNHDMVYKDLKVDPGTNPLCHFLGNKTVVWVPNLVVDNAHN
ncbi:hypothetical protein RIF29_15783 [Crotalaria pallida]|uniref:BURP domain-containing protein n=1 Tax=Crotalaria pallida TaxID=3830 RepID=A0AAN9FG27_CROPI